MKIIINVNNAAVYDRLVWVLKHFEVDGVKIVDNLPPSKQSDIQITDEYLERNWREIVSSSLANLPDCFADYEHSERYRLERGEYLMEKYK